LFRWMFGFAGLKTWDCPCILFLTYPKGQSVSLKLACLNRCPTRNCGIAPQANASSYISGFQHQNQPTCSLVTPHPLS
jgi:hypothetical protein